MAVLGGAGLSFHLKILMHLDVFGTGLRTAHQRPVPAGLGWKMESWKKEGAGSDSFLPKSHCPRAAVTVPPAVVLWWAGTG